MLSIGIYICLQEKDFYAVVLVPSQRVSTELFKSLLSKENAEDFCANADKSMSYIPPRSFLHAQMESQRQ